jgi:glutaminyl-tRNA synthetase
MNDTLNFIEKVIDEDNKSGKHGGKVITRFPPEPNGYLHIGHVKAIAIDFMTAEKYGGVCHLRMDDTNPEKEEMEFIESIQEDIQWLGFSWGDHLYYASDYYETLYEKAVLLIQKGLAYVDDLSPEEIREYRGTLTSPGKDSPYRTRSIEENLSLFTQMREGAFPDGSKVLRAKIDMASPNMNMRDPAMYRIRRLKHPRTGNTWCIYPMYDYAHPISDAIEGITHSLCSLEFEDHRPLYDWFVRETEMEHRPQQIEFARLNIANTVTSKRILRRLVEESKVNGWDDPRMPTVSGMRRRGFLPESIRTFMEKVGVSKVNSTVDYKLLEHCLREDLNKKADRVMAVLDPVKLVITNYPEGKVEWLEAVNNPEDESAGTREIPFSRELYIEREDYRPDAPKKWFRLAPGKEVRLKHAYYITVTDAVLDADGNVTEIHATYDPATKGGWSEDGRKVKGTVHWVSTSHAIDAEVREYETLFTKEVPGAETGEMMDDLNPESIHIISNAKVEPSLKERKPGDSLQFMRKAYYTRDLNTENLVFNRIVTLKDSWSKLEKQLQS